MAHLPKYSLLCLTFTLTLLAGACAPVQQPERGAEPVSTSTTAPEAIASATTAPEIELERYELENGLDVILVEDHRLPLVAVNVWYHVGPAHERPGRTGFAHLFEHMMFQGSKHAPEDAHFKLLEAAGASNINGTTSFDRTNYFETLPSNQLELALWLESDRMGFMLETLDYAKLRNQIDVVRNERRQSLENRPYGLVQEAVFHNLFPKNHPYHARIIGSHADIEAAELDDVREFFRQYYGPNNASLVIAGDIDPAKTKALVEKYFGTIEAGPTPPPIQAATPPLTEEKRITVTDRVELPVVIMAWLTPRMYTEADTRADLVAAILGGDKSSRLYKRLVYERQIAQNVSASQSSMGITSIFMISATAKPGVKPEELEQAIDEELARLRAEGVTQEEVTRVRNRIETGMISSLESIGNVADQLNHYLYFTGRPDYFAEDFQRYARPSLADLQEFANEHLAQDARLVVHGVPGEKVIDDVPRRDDPTAQTAAVQPEGASSSAGRDESWRAQPPAPGEAPTPEFPTARQFKLDNGLTVLLIEQDQLPLLSANLVVLSGSDVNPIQRPGLAAFTADMLDEGTGKRSALEIADAAGRIGASLGTGSSSDSSSVGIFALKKNAEAAFELLADVALNPSFPQNEIERIRKTRLTGLLQQQDDPNALAARVFSRAVYGTGHPYGYIELGTEDSLQTITREELMQFWEAGYTPDNAALVVSGAISADELRPLAEKYFGKWKGEAGLSSRRDPESKGERKILIVDKPGSPQTALRVGHVGVPRSSPDYVPLEVMNSGLGGLFSSRINMNLREQNGFTYGARSGFAFRRGPGPFTIGTSVRADVTTPAIREIFKEVERMRAEPVSAGELQAAKDAIARSLPAMFETVSRTAGTISGLYVYGLPLDYYSNLPEEIDAVTVADVQRVAKEYLHPSRMIVVAVGDRSKIEPELRKAGLGPVEVFDMNAKDAEEAVAGAAEPRGTAN